MANADPFEVGSLADLHYAITDPASGETTIRSFKEVHPGFEPGGSGTGFRPAYETYKNKLSVDFWKLANELGSNSDGDDSLSRGEFYDVTLKLLGKKAGVDGSIDAVIELRAGPDADSAHSAGLLVRQDVPTGSASWLATSPVAFFTGYCVGSIRAVQRLETSRP